MALALAAVPLTARAQAPVPSPSPAATAPTLEPATSPLQLPYPVFGTPVTGVVGPPSREYPTVGLKQSIAIAVARSPVLASARADASLAALQVRVALGAALPSLSASAATSRFRGAAPSSAQSGAATAQAVTQDQAALQVRQLIFDGFHTEEQIAAANAASVAAADTYRSALQQLALNVATGYYAALTAERQTGAALASLKNAQTQRALVAAQVAAGTAARSDISSAELQVAQARVAVIKAQASALTSLASFAATLGLSPEEVVQPVDDVPAGNPGAMSALAVPSYQDALKRAFALRPDWSAAQEQVLASDRSLRAARAVRWPTLAGSASAGSSSTDRSGGTFQPSWSVGAQLTLPIYEGGIIAAGIKTAQEQELKVSAAELTTRLSIESGVKQALIGLASAEAGLVAANQERATADETLQATEARYKAGVTTLPLLLQAQTGFTTALVDQVNAAYGVRQAEQQYLFAIGDNVKI
ncbi:TolC family protein [bacterium]|nr:MAG: TolC family protein [bacterium]